MGAQVSPSIPVKIWSQCFGDAQLAQASLEQARGFMSTLWGPETSLMGVPPGDMNDPDDDWTDTPETGDGLIDIYLLGEFSPSGHVRDFDVSGAYAVTASTPPIAGPTGALKTAAYIVVSPGLHDLLLELDARPRVLPRARVLAQQAGTLGLRCGQPGCGLHERHAAGFVLDDRGLGDVGRGSLRARGAWTARWSLRQLQGVADDEHGPLPDGGQQRLPLPGCGRCSCQQQAGDRAIANVWRAYEGKHGFAQLAGSDLIDHSVRSAVPGVRHPRLE